MGVLPVCLVLKGATRALGPLELELQTLVSCQVDASNQTLVLCQSTQCFQLLSHLPIPIAILLKV